MANNENSAEDDSKKKPKPRSSFKSLRILVIEPRGRYCRIVWCAIGLGLTQVMIGATIMAVLIYSLSNNDWHSALFAVAYHFFSAEAILSLNYANGWSTPMRLRHRRLAHAFLQVCAVGCAVTGTAIITISKGISTTVHGLTGLITAVLACLAFTTGPCALFGKDVTKMVHATFGMPTFVISSISFCCGILTPTFKSWAPVIIIYILIAFIIFYTICIIATCLLKCTMRI